MSQLSVLKLFSWPKHEDFRIKKIFRINKEDNGDQRMRSLPKQEEETGTLWLHINWEKNSGPVG